MKKSYLIHLKNRLWMHGISFHEIRDILADIAVYFDDVQAEESVQKSVLDTLGIPKEFVNNIQPVRIVRFIRMILVLMILVTFFTGIFYLMAETYQNMTCDRQVIVSIFVFVSMILIWFVSGNVCLIGILPLTKKQVRTWICFQIFLFLSAIILLYGMYIGVPNYIKLADSQNSLHTVWPAVRRITRLFEVFNVVIAAYCLTAYFKAEWLMFGIFMQSIGLICCAVFYQQYLGNLTEFHDINYIPIPLLLSFVFSVIIYIMILVLHPARN